MEASNNEAHTLDLYNEEIKNRIIEEMQNYTYMYDKSDPQHSDQEKCTQVFETIGALLGLDFKYFNDRTRKIQVKCDILCII